MARGGGSRWSSSASKLATSRRDNRAVQARRIEHDASIGAQRGDAVVVVRVSDGREHLVESLQRVLAHTDVRVPILLCGGELDDLEVSDPRVLGLAPTVDDAVAASAPADVVLLGSACLVAAGWLDRLRAA